MDTGWVLLDRAPFGVGMLDRDGCCLRVNGAFCRQLDMDQAELVGVRFPLAGDGELERVLAGETPAVEYDRELHGAAGCSTWLLVSASAEGADVLVTGHDITARKAREAVLCERGAMFRTIFEDSQVGIALVDAGGRFVEVNQTFAAMHARAREELAGVHFSELLPDEVREEHVARHEQWSSDAGVGAIEFDVPYRRADGTPGWQTVHSSIIRDRDGNALQNVAQVRDVTDHKRAEQALRESEERYRSLVEHLPVGIYRRPVEPGGGRSYVSPRMQAMLGYPADAWDINPELISCIVHPEDRERLLVHRRRLAIGQDLAGEYRILARDGRELNVLLTATVLEQNGEQYVQGCMQDISQQRQLEQQLRIAQKLEAIGQLAAGIAHEINTPIQFIGDSTAFIHGAVDDLLAVLDTQDIALTDALDAVAPGLRSELDRARDAADIEYLKERLPAAFERTADGIARVAEIVRAVRQFAHPNGGQRAPVDLNQALADTLIVTRSQYKLIADIETDLGAIPSVTADRGELNQVFINLIVNATHAIAELANDTQQRGVIRITTRKEPDHILITIADTGCGIPPQNVERIFDPFFTTKPFGHGTGQGLAITRSIICERHNGTITVNSRPNHGTTFELRLPATPTPPDAPPSH